ncbi:MAG: penicillin acylase family protein [Acidobacteria bacterium]|nr:penicillin acylase family protein [Acidobacteriota bacterium]
MRVRLGLLLVMACLARGENVKLAGLSQPVEILRDKWGVPHIYARSSGDLFFAQGYMAARDRLFQIDLWRRQNNGMLAEVQGPSAVTRDRIARLVRYRGNMDAEWKSYSPDTKEIVTAFVNGINAYIDGLGATLPVEFRIAGYKPGKWKPEDCLGRVAGLLMTRNVTKEMERAMAIRSFGAEVVARLMPPDPFTALTVPKGLDLAALDNEVLRDYRAAIATPQVREEDVGSNNWVVDGSRTVTGKPLLANDPHRPVNIPSLRKTWHLVAPGWNVFGAGEPALPGIALGHNENIAFGFTIVNIDQCDLYVEKVNPAKATQYWHKGQWREMEVEKQTIAVKGSRAREVELHYTVHGPVIYEDAAKKRAVALKWVGAEPGGAGYLAALGVSRAKNWTEFRAAVANYKVPSENLVYADTAGNIGWIASGLAPVRKNWNGLLPVPGDGEYEWSGYLTTNEHPQEYNPPRHWIATANHKILPKDYAYTLSFDWAQPFRYERIREVLSASGKLGVADFQKLQQDITSVAAREFQGLLRKHLPKASAEMKPVYQRMIAWDARMTLDSTEATLYAVWLARLGEFVDGSPLAKSAEPATVMRLAAKHGDDSALRLSYERAVAELEKALGPDRSQWKWSKVHTVSFTHPLRTSGENARLLNRGPVARPGEAHTVNSTSGTNFRQTNGASYREIIDVADWDRSVMTNVPGESGDPASKHYSNLLEEWAGGRYHPMLYSRKAVEAAVDERIVLEPRR